MSENFSSRSAARRMLWKWASTKATIERLERERHYFKTRMDEAGDVLKAQQLSGMPGSGRISDLSDIMAQIEASANMYAAQSERINAEIAETLQIRNMVEGFIKSLTPIQEKIVCYRYQDGYSWQFIGLKMAYDERSVRRIEEQAVDKLAEVMRNA